MWKKLMLRGGTRNSKGREELAYFKGGFGRLANSMVFEIERLGGCVTLNENVTSVKVKDSKVLSIVTDNGLVNGLQYLFTPAFPIIADIFNDVASSEWINQLRRVRYLSNMCLVLRLKKSLSEAYWLNVNDPGFPFVGVIEHTNFDSPENYKNSHIVYLSRYLSRDDPVWTFSDDEYLDYSFEHLKRMFPDLDHSWLLDSKVWRAEYAQPVTEKNYSEYVPGTATPFDNVYISTMAQIYPEDRGTNYAIRDGKLIAKIIAEKLI
jgi:protoporphyrinogen oxidase